MHVFTYSPNIFSFFQKSYVKIYPVITSYAIKRVYEFQLPILSNTNLIASSSSNVLKFACIFNLYIWHFLNLASVSLRFYFMFNLFKNCLSFIIFYTVFLAVVLLSVLWLSLKLFNVLLRFVWFAICFWLHLDFFNLRQLFFRFL